MNIHEFWDAKRELREKRERIIEKMLNEGHKLSTIADAAGVSEKTVLRRKAKQQKPPTTPTTNNEQHSQT